MTSVEINQLSDERLLAETQRAAAAERRSTTDLLALLLEVEQRGLHLAMGYSSLFTYCTRALRLSEQAAYSRITAARAVRRWPALTLLERLAGGGLTLSSLGLLAPHLTEENHESLVAAATHKSTRDVERLVACLHPQPDIAPSLRRVPAAKQQADADVGVPLATAASVVAAAEGPTTDATARPTGGAVASLVPLATTPSSLSSSVASSSVASSSVPTSSARLPFAPPSSAPPPSAPPRGRLVPISARRYLLRVTIGQETHDKLQRARDLLRHVIPDGDPGTIIDRALTLLVEQAAKSKYADRPPDHTPHRTRGPVPSRPSGAESTRYVPAEVKRAVWTRDAGRCAFVGAAGRCRETGFLEFHHVVPFAAGGPTDAVNLQLRCRAHNAHEARVFFGPGHPDAPPSAGV